MALPPGTYDVFPLHGSDAKNMDSHMSVVLRAKSLENHKIDGLKSRNACPRLHGKKCVHHPKLCFYPYLLDDMGISR